MREFKLPPTDQRYMDTPFPMMEFLFIDFLETLDPLEISRRYKRYQASKEERERFKKELVSIDDDLILMGHTKETIEMIKEELKKEWEKDHAKNWNNR